MKTDLQMPDDTPVTIPFGELTAMETERDQLREQVRRLRLALVEAETYSVDESLYCFMCSQYEGHAEDCPFSVLAAVPEPPKETG